LPDRFLYVPDVVRSLDPRNVTPLDDAARLKSAFVIVSGPPDVLSNDMAPFSNCRVPLPRAEAWPMLSRAPLSTNVLPV
jgi:hypothetical protein